MKKTCKKIIFLFFFSCSILLSYPQSLPYEKYTSKNGLISDRITAITQDEKGFMWFGSYFGICRYDGIKFEKIALPAQQQNKFITFLLPANNKMYAGFLFNSGLLEYNNGRSNAYFVKGKDSAKANEFICASGSADGSILLCNASNQIYQFKNGTFTRVYSLQQKSRSFFKAIQKDNYKNIWIATGQGLLILPFPYKHEQWYFAGENIFSLSKAQNGKIWFCRMNVINTTYETIEGWQGNLLNENITGTTQNLAAIPFSGNTAKGFWGIGAKGLINISEKKIQNNYKAPLDLSTDINAIFSDRENNIWIANEPGIIKISNFNIQSFLFDELAADGGGLYLENDSSLWVSNSKNLYIITGNNIKKKHIVESREYYGNVFIDSKKDLWINFWNQGLWHVKRNYGRIISKKYFSEFNNKQIKVQSIIEDSNHIIWIAGLNGIFRIKNNAVIENFNVPNIAGAPAFITGIALDEKNKIIWLGDNSAGIIKVKYDVDANNKITCKVLNYINQQNGLKDTYIRSLLLDNKNDLWAGTRSGGIYKMNESGKVFTVLNYNKAANISCTRITDIQKEDTTALWFATCDGIYRYHYSTNKWEHYNTSDGLLNTEVFNIAVDAKNKVVWALSSQGVTKLAINTQEKTLPPLINITGVNVLGKPDTAALSSHFGKYSYTQNSIGFSFAGASFIDEKKIKYKYMLQPYDKTWSAPVMTNNVNYASLPPGKYVFKVLAANAKEQWSEQPATFAFEIVMPVYKKTWFIFMLIILAILIIYFIRVQQLKQRFKIEQLRLNIARDLHDDVGSALGSINLLSKTATRRLDKNLSAEEISPVFKKIGESAENTLEAMDDIVWSINPEKDTVQDIIIRMREFAIPLFEAKNIRFSFVLEGNTGMVLPVSLRRNAFLIYKESIHNIIKHSEAGKVGINIRAENNRFSITISDNGKGFDPQLLSNRHGLKNMHQRTEIVRGTLQINSTGNGTTILFTAPLR